ncbi:MAG: hypothetical protein AAFX01_09165 [Cyanobacteria bacterium J06638_28]
MDKLIKWTHLSRQQIADWHCQLKFPYLIQALNFRPSPSAVVLGDRR